MVAEYLKREKKKYDEVARTTQDEISRIDTKLIENEKFTALLESETEKVFKDFTPREIDSKNRRKINELKEERQKLLSQKEGLVARLEEAKGEANELRQSIAEVKDLEMQAADSRWFEENYYNAADGEEEPPDESLVSGKAAERLEGILKYLLSDPLRAKMELEAMVKKAMSQD